MKASAIYAWILALRVVCPAVAQNWDSGGYFANWFNRVDKTQAQQPHWITPLFTTTPRLEEEFRSDITWTPATGGESLNYGSGKGLELIPTEHTEIILGVPPYQVPAEGPAGGGNIPLLLKYRLLAVTSSTATTSSRRSSGAAFLLAASPPSTAPLRRPSPLARGYRNFDFQSTLGWTIPTGGRQTTGTPVAYNTAFQYRVLRKLWPELEANVTLWPNGSAKLVGQKQVFMSPGLVAGRFHLWRRLGMSVGAGEQIAVTHFHQYNHAKVLSIRFPF